MNFHPAPISVLFTPFSDAAPVPHPLLALGFGQGETGLPKACPLAFPGLRPLGGDGFLEVLASDTPAQYGVEAGFSISMTQSLLCGALDSDASAAPFDELAFMLYGRLFDLIERLGYPHLLKLYNYIPDITGRCDGLERYQRFSLGRHNAFAARSRPVASSPAACALGSRNGPFTLAFIAAKAPGLAIENPRQISAYSYPERYGPRSPIFSRGVIARIGGAAQFFLSGTASIVGHESRHVGDAVAQAQEAVKNVETMRAEAEKMGMPQDFPMRLKAYLRDPALLDRVAPVLRAALKERDELRILEADICRPDLLLEIDGASLG